MRWLQPLRFPKEVSNSNMCRALAILNTTPPYDVHSHHFASYTGKGNTTSTTGGVTRDWLAKIWKQEMKQWKDHKHKLSNSETNIAVPAAAAAAFASFKLPFVNYYKEEVSGTPTVTTTGSGSGDISAERKLATVLATDNLVIARDIEWANVLFAFEQESRYVIMDASSLHAPVAYIRETSNLIFRQLLRARRPFVAHIIDSHGNEIFQVRRPFWLINSTIYAEVDGKEVGVVHRRWHLWKRIYDLYLGNKQFAVVENPGFWNWTFTLKDEEGNALAQIDRNWRGIGLELFTDAGQYVIRFGGSVSVQDGSSDHMEEFEVARPLTLPERAVALALAVSLDCDYFSRRGGWGLPIMILEE